MSYQGTHPQGTRAFNISSTNRVVLISIGTRAVASHYFTHRTLRRPIPNSIMSSSDSEDDIPLGKLKKEQKQKAAASAGARSSAFSSRPLCRTQSRKSQPVASGRARSVSFIRLFHLFVTATPFFAWSFPTCFACIRRTRLSSSLSFGVRGRAIPPSAQGPAQGPAITRTTAGLVSVHWHIDFAAARLSTYATPLAMPARITALLESPTQQTHPTRLELDSCCTLASRA